MNSDPLAGLKNNPDLYVLFCQQPEPIKQAYLDWWNERVETAGRIAIAWSRSWLGIVPETGQ